MSASTPTSQAGRNSLHFTGRVILKALLLFLLVNLLFAALYPVAELGRVSVYNTIVPGRKRLPYGENPAPAYNLSLFNLDAMFSSHEISAANKPDDEFRVILIGDSSTWGYLLPVEDTLSAAITRSKLQLADGRLVRAYNLGYPVMSLAKDLLILSRAVRYDPDMVVWLVTLESFPYDKQLSPPLIQNNPAAFSDLIRRYNLPLQQGQEFASGKSFLEKTIVGSRRQLADWLRLQFYGLLWAATGIDQDIPQDYPAVTEDLPDELSFHDLQPPKLDESQLSFDLLNSGIEMVEGIPLLVVNEPMFISQGENSDIRYNFYYPRWAYDDYRRMLAERSAEKGWDYLDLWDYIAPKEFTNTAIHLTPKGTNQLAGRIGEAILGLAER
ncbi:MAG: hypothetical protein ACWGO1_03830 [Anaerolineales bacterium]